VVYKYFRGIIMKKFLTLLILLIIICPKIKAQTDRTGFFIGGGFSALIMNGKVTADNEDFDVTDDLVDLESEAGAGGGLGWDSRNLYGFMPIGGYWITPQIAIVGSYTSYFNKNTKDSESLPEYGLYAKASLEYSQKTARLMGQYYLGQESIYFIGAGVEIVSMSIDQPFELSWNIPEVIDFHGVYKVTASGNAVGLVFGGGIDYPLPWKNVSISATASYSTTKWDGDISTEIIEYEGSEDFINGEDTKFEFGVGGFSGNIGIIISIDI
jgi:hypothetical protein